MNEIRRKRWRDTVEVRGGESYWRDGETDRRRAFVRAADVCKFH